MPSRPARSPSKLRFPPAAGAIVGCRDEQQDTARIETFEADTGAPALLMIVADGMGGHAGGQEASRVASDAFANSFLADPGAQFRPRLRDALEAANRAVAARSEASRDLRGMGCTIVAAVLAGDYLRWISVGDSLLLAIKDRQVVRLNADHSLAPELDRAAREGRISRDEADSDPDRHVLRSAVTGGRMNLIDEGARRVGEGALVLLATDGILTLSGEHLARIASQGEPAEATIRLLLAAIEADMPPDQDNTTLVAAYCEGGEGSASRRRRARRRRFGAAALLVAALGAASSAYILVADDGRETRAGPAKPSVDPRRRLQPPAPRQRTKEVDGRLFKPLVPAADRPRLPARERAPDRSKRPPRRTAPPAAAGNAGQASRDEPATAPRPASPPPDLPIRNSAATPNEGREEER